MKRLQVRQEFKTALSALLIGAFAAPIYHVASSIIAPQGFASMRGDRLWLAPLILAITWLWSVGPTLTFGGIAWSLLHRMRVDGYVTYVAVALIAAFGLSLVSGARLPSGELLIMAVLNALAVRFAELRLRSVWPESQDVLATR